LRATRPQRVWRMESFDAETLSVIFMRSRKDGMNTTWRDAAYFEQRYGQSPNFKEYCFYLAGTQETPTHYLIARHLTQPDGLRYTRILDLFGNMDDSTPVRDLLLFSVQDALERNSSQTTLVTFHPSLTRAAKRLGFIFSTVFAFCWWSPSADWMSAFTGENYWTLSDSDNDAPD